MDEIFRTFTDYIQLLTSDKRTKRNGNKSLIYGTAAFISTFVYTESGNE